MNDASRYDALLEAGREPATSCPVCTGDDDAEPCGEDCAELIERARNSQRIANLHRAARTAILLARLYKTERVSDDKRIVGCLEQVQAYRASIRSLRGAA